MTRASADPPDTEKLRDLTYRTKVLPVDAESVRVHVSTNFDIDSWNLDIDETSQDLIHLRQAAEELRTQDVPVAFPTETVYGLGADATRSSAVQGIFKAKNRPSDNPLIVHVHSLLQLRDILRQNQNGSAVCQASDPIPQIYQPLIKRFWPGPLTIILPNHSCSVLATEVTAGLKTFGARIPSAPIALALLRLGDIPLAAPSANASTKPSPTRASHVWHDLNGRISTIIDGGPCDIGVESTVVDGLSDPPLILRPGGISITDLLSCPGWENVKLGYQNSNETVPEPKAPGMKYKHYSPKARVVLYEHPASLPSMDDILKHLGEHGRLSIIRTIAWPAVTINGSRHLLANGVHSWRTRDPTVTQVYDPQLSDHQDVKHRLSGLGVSCAFAELDYSSRKIEIVDLEIGTDPARIARNLFTVLRDLDSLEMDVILVEGIRDDNSGPVAAIMNRLRKAAHVRI